jgi:hypothetical protein
MALKADIPELERVTFFPGQQLSAADLTEFERANRELRWLHNRSLHGWGIGIGLGVTGERGDGRVLIDAGYAVDGLGREIILTESRTKKVPAVAGSARGDDATFYLTAAYQADEEQRVAESRPGVCQRGDAVRLKEEPRIEWRTAGQLQEGREVVLAQAWIRNCRLSRPLSLAVRRSARPAHQPYIAAGQTVAGETDWTAWQIGTRTLGVTTRGDTSTARFQTVPRYQAHIAGNRVAGPATLADGLPRIANPTPTGFECHVLMPQNLTVGAYSVNPPSLNVVDAVMALQWQVVWMGIEG